MGAQGSAMRIDMKPRRGVYVYEQGIGAEKCELAIREAFQEAFRD